ncbi:MAG: ComEC/Rec2 family competence protein [Cyanobacteriota bacterium]|nr:ComEC/Rec2 family competence protein [Cyanobacteriota bacterium]
MPANHAALSHPGGSPSPPFDAPLPAASGSAPPPDARGMPRPRTGRWITLALTLALVLWASQRPPQPGPNDPLRRLEPNSASAFVVVRGRLVADAQRHADGSCQALLQQAGGRTELRLPACAELREGWLVRASGVLQRPPLAPHPLLAGPAERLARQGCWTRLRVQTLEVIARPATPVADLRRRIAERFLTWAGPERGGLLAALVLGSAVVPLPQALREAFRVSGLSHALAASGFHLTVLLGAVLVLARPFGRVGRLILAGGAILLFLLLAGPQPSVVRAVLMGALALGAREAGLRGKPLGLLTASAVGMLLLRPDWLHDVGFQLSVAATAGLVVSADRLEAALRPPLEATPLVPPAWRARLAALLAPALAVPLAASLWTLPLQLLHFGVVPLWAVPANVLAAPLLTPLTLGAMGAAVVGLVAPPLQALAMPPLAWLAQALLAVAQGTAALPMAQWHSGRLPLWLVTLFSLGLLGWVVPRSRQLRGWALALLLLASGLHLHQLRADALVLVQDSPRTLLLARHQGRGALISARADAISCRQAQRLASGYGLSRYDWLVLLDAVSAPEPGCWERLARVVVAETEGPPPLASGRRLASPGLEARGLTDDSQALELTVGHARWLLLPNRQALWSWRQRGRPQPDNIWLGFTPGASDRRLLAAREPRRVWLSGSPRRGSTPLTAGWRATGERGHLSGSA